ncbi:hypothetical protein BZA05DRAFT_389339 [Tricharina praecox]|uniref:uncharacterized protein n=1 Tax=Tricharina praecox TaxID=43433 RepID=UPI0022202040|nr:uncharacterized protein BZA05DRAFT_389339 [Tricharina praecox]KAI5855681.1 hypothetical protein BZA05DRAFT_389339 [Tricharina praecox]
MSDGTIEIEGFGFDTISEFGDDSSVWGGESMYEGSVYDGQEGSGEPDISRRAEKVLASAKRRLDLCGQNISRARSSLILSPSATPNALLEHLDAVGPVVRRRAESAGGANSPHWRYNNARTGNEERGVTATGMAHVRTASESAVTDARSLGIGRSFGDLRGLSDLVEDPRETDKQQQQQPARTVSRCNSAQQMRALRDQMKDLRGKITTLQEQTKTVKGRQSGSSLRSSSTPGSGSGSEETTPKWSPTSPNLEEIRESRALNIHTTIEQEWEHVATQRSSSQYSVDGSDCSGTPTGPRREEVNSPVFARQEIRSDAFSYDNYLFGESFFKGIRPASLSSDGTESTATATLPPLDPPRLLERKDSFVSISSYATADEDREDSARASPSLADQLLQLRAPSSTPTIPGGWLTASSPGDDGYHSAPHTPHVDKELPQTPSDEPPPPVAASSWYRESVDTTKTQSMFIYEDDSDVEGGGEGGHGGGVPLTIATSTRDSQTMVVGGMGVGGKEEVELRIGRSDRVLIEGVIEALGRVCCAMESEGERSRSDLRERLREAMRVLEGDDGEMF